MITGLGPKNLSGGGWFDAGPRHFVENFQESSGVLAGLAGGPSQGSDAGGGLRPVDDLEEPTGDAEADPLGLSDGGEVVLDLRCDLHGVGQTALEDLGLGPLRFELLLELVDASLGRVAGNGLDDVVSFVVEGLARLVAIIGHGGDIARPAAKHSKSTGDPLGNRNHGESIH